MTGVLGILSLAAATRPVDISSSSSPFARVLISIHYLRFTRFHKSESFETNSGKELQWSRENHYRKVNRKIHQDFNEESQWNLEVKT